eukprot:5300589-Pyramimonas_sp.AAC.1
MCGLPGRCTRVDSHPHRRIHMHVGEFPCADCPAGVRVHARLGALTPRGGRGHGHASPATPQEK